MKININVLLREGSRTLGSRSTKYRAEDGKKTKSLGYTSVCLYVCASCEHATKLWCQILKSQSRETISQRLLFVPLCSYVSLYKLLDLSELHFFDM